MESRGYLSNKNGRNGSVEHISQLCRHIIKKDIIDTDPQLKSKIEDSIRTNLQSSISILNKAPSAQDDNTVNEFSAAENIKKYLVRDSREKDTVKFSELHLRLQKSSMIKNRDAILSLFLHLAEKTNKPGQKRIPPFYLSTTGNPSLNGVESKRAGQQKSVISISASGTGDTYLTKVIPAPYRSRTNTENDKEYRLKSPGTPSNQAGSGYPPIAPKPNYIAKSPHEPSPPRHFHNLHLDDGDKIKTGEGALISASNNQKSEKSHPNASESYIDDLDGIDGGVCSNELETRILRELIYAFQGIEGVMIRRKHKNRSALAMKGLQSDTTNTNSAEEDCELEDTFCGFTLAPEHIDKYPPTHTKLALRLAELGYLYNRVNSFCEQTQAKDETHSELGLVGQSLITALRNELTEYYRLLSILEAQLKSGMMGLTLHQLSVYTMEPMERMKLLATIVKTCGRLRGGALISAIYGFLHHGDPMLSATVQTLLTTVCKPMYNMILKWIFDGILEDPFTEFFIAANPKVNDESRLWHDKYSIRRSMIPKFMGLSLGKKILATGKGLNFLRSVCKEDCPIPRKEAVMKRLDGLTADLLFSETAGNRLHEAIEHCYRETSSLVLDTMFRRYKLMDHVSAMRKYLLLGQGDLIRYLLELLDEELNQPAANLYPHNLAGILESAIRATNTQFEDPDILERLDVRLLDVQPGDTGWDVFSLDYKVQGPIGTIFGQKTLTNYLMLFNALWRGKRMEYMLSCMWTKGTALHKMARILTEMGNVLQRAHLLSSEMIHFVHQLAYYTTFEVMECSWDLLEKQLGQSSNLDEVIEAHNEFIETLVKHALLDERSRDLLTQLRAIYDRIVEFQNIQNKLYLEAVAELEARRSLEDEINSRTRRGQYGITNIEERREKKRRDEFCKTILPEIEAKLKIVSQSYQDMVKTFLLQLSCSQDQSLQFLSVRLDFNEHYKRKDSRLGAPLTFQHKRLSTFE